MYETMYVWKLCLYEQDTERQTRNAQQQQEEGKKEASFTFCSIYLYTRGWFVFFLCLCPSCLSCSIYRVAFLFCCLFLVW